MTDWLALDEPADPEGCAISDFRADERTERYKYAMVCGRRHRMYFTNSIVRFKNHYRAARKRRIPGTWFKRRELAPGFFGFYMWRLILSDGVFGL